MWGLERLPDRLRTFGDWLATVPFFAPRTPLTSQPASDGVGDPPDLGPDTIKYLNELASESFKRQADLDESIWRSLPFFAATFAFVATIIGQSASNLPDWVWSTYAFSANGLLLAAVASMAWVLRWFWTVLRPREYEYPAPDSDVRTYADQITSFHVERGLCGTQLDAAVTSDLRLFMVDQLGSGAATNLGHNAVKLRGRSKVLLFMLLGFAFTFASQATIFVHDRVYGMHTLGRGVMNVGAATSANATAPGSASQQPPAPSKSAIGHRRRAFLGSEFEGEDRAQVMARKPTASGQPPVASQTKPTPPDMQVLTKLNEDSRGSGIGSSQPPRDKKP